jgi:hypothetical protein
MPRVRKQPLGVVVPSHHIHLAPAVFGRDEEGGEGRAKCDEGGADGAVGRDERRGFERLCVVL